MEYDVLRDPDRPDAWHVQAWNVKGDGELYGAMFYGVGGEERARAYATLMNLAILAQPEPRTPLAAN